MSKGTRVRPLRTYKASDNPPKPVPPKRLKVGKMYRFTPTNVKDECNRLKGKVIEKYERFYLVETTIGYRITINNYAVGNDIQVVEL